jgi:hypothetical protein
MHNENTSSDSYTAGYQYFGEWVFNPVSGSFTTQYFNDFLNSPRKVAASMKTMDGYIRTYKFLDEHDSYMSHITAVKTPYVRLCNSGSFQTCNT